MFFRSLEGPTIRLVAAENPQMRANGNFYSLLYIKLSERAWYFLIGDMTTL